MRTFRSGVVVAAAALAVATVPMALPSASAASDPLASYLGQQLTWGNCAFTPAEHEKTAQCAQVTVPRDWANPGAGVDLQVSISRVAATGNKVGAILVNPGGPGGQGSSLAGKLAGLEPSVNESYDFIGMDPRGTGQEGTKGKGFLCTIPSGAVQPTVLDARDRSPQSIAAHQQAARAIAEACQSESLAPYITTWQTAHDMDLIRALLGQGKLNYLGYSYGTWLGAKYASLFPDHVGKVVLDSSMNFEGREQADFEQFPVIDQRQFDDVYLPWLARQFPQFGKTAAEVKTTWEKVRAYYKAQGVSPDAFDELYVGNGSPSQWMLGELALSQGMAAIDGTAAQAPASLKAQLDSESRAAFGVPAASLTAADVVAAMPKLAPDNAQTSGTSVNGTRYAVACGDQPTHSASWYKQLSDQQGPQYPLDGWAYGITEPCGFWTEQPQHQLPNLPAQVAKDVLVVQGEFDPQTGYEGAKEAARTAGVPLVSVDNSPFHGQYAISGNPCVDGLVNTFLTKNSRPGNTTCPGVPLPGENQVYPVAGPVDGSHGGLTALPDAFGLRQLVQDVISKLNHNN